MMLKRNRQRGFTLIELLIVVAIIGIIAAILIPNLIDALQKAKQKRTVSDLRNTGTAFMSWLTDQISAGAAGAQPYDGSGLTTSLTYAQLVEYLNPAGDVTFYYMQEIPQFDGWNNAYQWFHGSNLLLGTVICGQSFGRDGTVGPPNTGNCNSNLTGAQTGAFIATWYDHDIMWADGFFIMYPAGVAGTTP